VGTNRKSIRTPKSSASQRLVILSDTHQLHREVEVPDGDILIHSGDFTMFSKSMNAIVDFNQWLGELPHRFKGWGSPVTPLYGGAFGLSSAEDRRKLCAEIPEDTDVLITHGPPCGVLDCEVNSGLHSGCRELFDAVMRVRPKLHVFGHVHSAHGIFQTDQTTFVNAALFGVDGDLENSPIVLRMTSR
jgi:hypothetical protein